jgi:hypothetical protein
LATPAVDWNQGFTSAFGMQEKQPIRNNGVKPENVAQRKKYF